MKHQLQSSPGSNDEMIACLELRKCLRAWRFLESSQQPTCPQVLHKRRCTQVSPMARHSWQPSPPGITALTVLRCVHCSRVLAIHPVSMYHDSVPSCLDTHLGSRSSGTRTPFQGPCRGRELRRRTAFLMIRTPPRGPEFPMHLRSRLLILAII